VETRLKPKRHRRTKKAEMQDVDAAQAAEAAPVDAAPPNDEQQLDAQLLPPRTTDLYTDEDWRLFKHAVERYARFKSDLHRHRTEWLEIIGPALVKVRDRALELSGATNVKSPHYQDAIREELKRSGLDVIGPSERSYCLKIMDNLSDVEKWLSERPNPDRLNHPKTIWQAFENRNYLPNPEAWDDDPHCDREDEDYWGIESDEEDEEEQEENGGDDASIAANDEEQQQPSEQQEAVGTDTTEQDRDDDGDETGDQDADGADDGETENDQEDDQESELEQDDESKPKPPWAYFDFQFNDVDNELDYIVKDIGGEEYDLSIAEAEDRAMAIERLERIITKARACINALETNDKRYLQTNDIGDGCPRRTLRPGT
jgi:hypothetical protein